jgi:hypothetical protein
VTVENIALARSDDYVVAIVIARTNIPSQALPPELILPARARISFGEDTIKIRVRLAENADFSDAKDSDLWQAEDSNAEYHSIELINKIRGVDLNGTWPQGPRRPKCCAILKIRDPNEVEEFLTIHFASLDRNNPGYWINLVAKTLNRRYGIPIREIEDIPF